MNTQAIIERIRRDAFRLNGPDDLQPIVEAAGSAKLVLLGEASHGTSEFYTLRAELTKRLITQKGFRFIAVEGDWPACWGINRYIKSNGAGDLAATANWPALFDRWPTWMWANREIAELAEWLKRHNAGTGNRGNQIGFYGIDVYSLWESMEEMVRHFESTGSGDVELAKRALSCFEPHSREGQSYGVSAAFYSESCEDEVVKLLAAARANRAAAEEGSEAALSAEINALVAVNAESYYRAMVRGGPESWNIRDRHMTDALERISAFYGDDAKGIVWEHNTHIGDARATDMAEEGMLNVGQLLRERLGRDRVYAVGFGTFSGTVIAGKGWGEPMEEMTVPEAAPGSWEACMHEANGCDQAILFDESQTEFSDPIGHRAIGVVYHPQYERRGNYVPSVMNERYNAFIHVERSRALRPLASAELRAAAPR